MFFTWSIVVIRRETNQNCGMATGFVALKHIFSFWVDSMHPLNDVTFTLPETNIAPENGCLEYYFPFGNKNPTFRGFCC